MAAVGQQMPNLPAPAAIRSEREVYSAGVKRGSSGRYNRLH
jgi:hypothetical protein